MSSLEQLRKFSVVVADTGDLESIRQFQPQDATTNPSLALKAAENCPDLIKKTLRDCSQTEHVSLLMDRLLVELGCEILKAIPGRVSTEVDAHLSFDVNATVQRAREIIKLYHAKNISNDRVLIKIASTWEGIQAAKILEKEGIHCNLTLLFSLEQAMACAEAGVSLISPFVGRILDWYRSNRPENLASDPGVESVKTIFDYFKTFDYSTEIMAASFRNTDEILALSGCDLLTISPKLLAELSTMNTGVDRKLFSTGSFSQKVLLTEAEFRFHLNENAMATEKLSEGIRNFCSDIRKLESLINKSK